MPKIASEEKPVDDKSTGSQPKTTFTILKAAGPAPPSTEEQPSTPTIKIATRPKGPPDHATPSTESSVDDALVKGMEALDVDEEGNENESTFDEFLITALKNRNDRIFLLKLELEFTNFINNQSQEQLDFPSLNSYYRMVIHRVANYFKLTRVVDPIHKTIIMYKTDQSAIPALRFSDLMEEEEEQVVRPMKVLKRTPNRPSAGAFTADGSAESDRRTVSIKEREEAYAKARARIFQEDAPKPKSPEEGSGLNSRSDSPSTKSDTVDESKSKPKKHPNGRKAGSESRTPEEIPDLDTHNGASASSSRDVSRSTSPSLDPKASKGKPKPKHSKSDLALECTDVRRRKSTTPTSSSGSRTHGLARTISSSSSQDGTHSPSHVTTLTESPTVNSPSNPSLTKGPDYFGPNPQSNSGSVSPMSSASSRNSGGFSHNNGPKQYRQSGNNNFNSPGSGFAKGMNTPFVPKKAHSKGPTNQGSVGGPNTQNHHNHNQNHNHQGSHHLNMNGSNGNYTQQYPGMAAPWPDRHVLHQDSSNLYNPADLPHSHGAHNNHQPQSFPYSHPVHQHGPSMPPFNHNQQMQAPFYHNPQRQGSGARRYQSTQQHYQNQPHNHHHQQQHNQHYPYHARTHPPVHVPQHQINTHPTSRDDFAYAQGMQSSQRFDRPYDTLGNNTTHPQQYTNQQGVDFNPQHGNDMHNPHMFPGFGHPQTSSPGDGSFNSPRHQYTQKGQYDPNWGPNHVPHDPTSMPFNSMQAPIGPDSVWNKPGGKKLYNYQPSVGGGATGGNNHHHQFASMHQGPVPGFPPQNMMGGSSGGPGQYDIDRRPPKSAELFDPDGPQPGSVGHHPNNRSHSFHDDGGMSERQFQGSHHNGPNQAQYSRQVNQQQAHHQPSTSLGHTSVGMTRTYSSSSSASYDGTPKCTPEVEKPSALSHILEIYDYSPNDNIFDDLVLPSGSKLRRLKPNAKDGTSSSGQCLVVFKNAALATEAMTTFQEGRESWMGSSTKLTFEGEEATTSDDSQDACARIQLRFNVRVWTPVLVNSVIPVGSTSLSSSMAPSPSSATATTHPSSLGGGSQSAQDSTENNGESVDGPESATENDGV
ncbi:R3H domain-containing protein 1 [Podila verticillata]|nr:R3H domain-containing protein 1 [Podila verticillata]